jgi:ribosomal protein L31
MFHSGPAGQSTPPRGDIGRLRSSFGLRPGNISSQYTVQSTTRPHLLTVDVCGPLSVFVQVRSSQYTVKSTTRRHLLTVDVCGRLSVFVQVRSLLNYTVQSTTRHHRLTLDICGSFSVFVQVTSLLNILYCTVYNPPDITC